jgi:hypothetical protein
VVDGEHSGEHGVVDTEAPVVVEADHPVTGCECAVTGIEAGPVDHAIRYEQCPGPGVQLVDVASP